MSIHGSDSEAISQGVSDVSSDLPREIIGDLARALSETQDFVALLDDRGNIRWANDALAVRHGLGSDDLIGQSFQSLLDPDLGDLAQEVLIAVINDGFFNGELLVSSAGGSIPAYVMATYIPPTRSGDDFGILFVAHDRSLEKTREEEARRRREFLSKIIRRAPLGIFCMDLKGEITIVNDSFREMAARIGIEIKTGNSIASLKEKLNPELIAVIEAGLQGRQADFGDTPLLAGNHPRPVVNIMANPIVSPDGYTEGLVVILEDRTEKVRIAEKLRETDRLSSLGILAAGVAHEVNNPLAGIIGIMEVLRKEAGEKGMDDDGFERMSANLKRIENIVRGLLDFSRKRINIVRDIDINEIVDRTGAFFRLQPRFKGINISTQLCGELPIVRGDPDQIEQVLQDLIINSAQAIENEGRITISTDYDNAAREVIIRIKDNGCGIPLENLDKIFEPFFTTKGPSQGTGLGLAVSLSLVHQHGGTIIVEETSNKGTIFAVRLPVSRDIQKNEEP